MRLSDACPQLPDCTDVARLPAALGRAARRALPAATPASVGDLGRAAEPPVVDGAGSSSTRGGRPASSRIVVRQGKVVHLEAFGKRDIESGAPMQKDTIFRIASMSKAITSVAAMILLEEGKLLLNDPVSKFIPSFAKTTVMVPPPAGRRVGHAGVGGAGQACRSRFAIC